MIGKLFDFKEASQWLECNAETLRQWKLRGEVLPIMFGTTNYLDVPELSLLMWAKNPDRAPEFDALYKLKYEDRRR